MGQDHRVEAGNTPTAAPPVQSLERARAPDFELDQRLGGSPRDLPGAHQAVAGDIGVLRKTASSAAAKREMRRCRRRTPSSRTCRRSRRARRCRSTRRRNSRRDRARLPSRDRRSPRARRSPWRWPGRRRCPRRPAPCRAARRQVGQDEERQAERRHQQRRPEGGPRAEALHGATGQRRRGDGREEDEIDEAERHGADAERRLHQHEIDIGEGADEGEQDAEADGEARAQARGS